MGLLDALGTGLGFLKEGVNMGLVLMDRAYDKSVQLKTWEREDNAVQRRAADLKAAGLNPVLAAGSAAATSAPISLNTPQVGDGMNQGVDFAARMIKQKADVSRTEAENKLIEQQAQNASLANQGLVLENAKKGLSLQEDWYNFDLARKAGVRSDMTGGTQAQVQQFLNWLDNRVGGDFAGAVKEGFGKLGLNIASSGEVPGLVIKPPPGYEPLSNGKGWKKIERAPGSEYAQKQGFTPKSKQY